MSAISSLQVAKVLLLLAVMAFVFWNAGPRATEPWGLADLAVTLGAGALAGALAWVLDDAITSRRVIQELKEPRQGRDQAERRRLLRGDELRIFYYRDTDGCRALYSQLRDREAQTTEIEKSTQRGSKLEGTLRFLKPSIHRERAEKVREVFAPENDPVRQYMAVEDKLLDLKHVEFFAANRDPSEVAKARADVVMQRLETDEKMAVPPTVRQHLTQLFLQEAASSELQKMRGLRGYVVIMGDVEYKAGGSTDSFELHAIRQASDLPSIVLVAHTMHIQSGGHTIFVSGQIPRVTAVTSVLSWDEHTKALRLMPIAIFA